MNGAVITGSEEDVGTRTSFHGFTTNTLKLAKYIFIPSDLRDCVTIAAAIQGQTVSLGTDRGDGPWEHFGHRAAENLRFLPPGFISYVTHNFLSSPRLADVRVREMYMPSTGALMLITALHTCDQLSAFGFLTGNYASFSDHYYDSVWRPLSFYANHDPRASCGRSCIIMLYQRSEDS